MMIELNDLLKKQSDLEKEFFEFFDQTVSDVEDIDGDYMKCSLKLYSDNDIAYFEKNNGSIHYQVNGELYPLPTDVGDMLSKYMTHLIFRAV